MIPAAAQRSRDRRRERGAAPTKMPSGGRDHRCRHMISPESGNSSRGMPASRLRIALKWMAAQSAP